MPRVKTGCPHAVALIAWVHTWPMMFLDGFRNGKPTVSASGNPVRGAAFDNPMRHCACMRGIRTLAHKGAPQGARATPAGDACRLCCAGSASPLLIELFNQELSGPHAARNGMGLRALGNLSKDCRMTCLHPVFINGMDCCCYETI